MLRLCVFKSLYATRSEYSAVASGSGRGGRRFKFCHSDHYFKHLSNTAIRQRNEIRNEIRLSRLQSSLELEFATNTTRPLAHAMSEDCSQARCSSPKRAALPESLPFTRERSQVQSLQRPPRKPACCEVGLCVGGGRSRTAEAHRADNILAITLSRTLVWTIAITLSRRIASGLDPFCSLTAKTGVRVP